MLHRLNISGQYQVAKKVVVYHLDWIDFAVLKNAQEKLKIAIEQHDWLAQQA